MIRDLNASTVVSIQNTGAPTNANVSSVKSAASLQIACGFKRPHTALDARTVHRYGTHGVILYISI
jgi:hypothetical protein